MINKTIRKIRRVLGIKTRYQSETFKVRDRVIEFCAGHGCDIGFGGDKIKKENCIGIDYAIPYTNTGSDHVDIACDVINERIPIDDGTFDYVYTSHLIEDFVDTRKGLEEFIRILRSGGHLILVFPDQKVYEEHCLRTGQPLNACHVHKNMGLPFMMNELQKLSNVQFDVLYQSNCEIDYNVIIVLKIRKS